jgi:hypothetical protein
MSVHIRRVVIGLTVALGFAHTHAVAQSRSHDVMWRWTGVGTIPCSGVGTPVTFTVIVDATFEGPQSESAPDVAILKNLSARAYSPAFRNGGAMFSLSADVVPTPPVTTGRRDDFNTVQAQRSRIRFVQPTGASIGTPPAPEESARLVLGVIRVARSSAIKFTAAAGVTTASGTCFFGTSTYQTPTVATLQASPPPAAPQGLRIKP